MSVGDSGVFVGGLSVVVGFGVSSLDSVGVGVRPGRGVAVLVAVRVAVGVWVSSSQGQNSMTILIPPGHVSPSPSDTVTIFQLIFWNSITSPTSGKSSCLGSAGQTSPSEK